MRILFIGSGDVSDLSAQAVHVGEVLNNLALRNKVIAIATRDTKRKPTILDLKLVEFRNMGSYFHGSQSKLSIHPFILSIFRCLWFCLREVPKCDVLYVRDATALVALPLKMLMGKPLVFEINGTPEGSLPYGKGRFRFLVASVAQSILTRYSDRIIAVTPELKSYLVARYHVSESKIIVISNGVNTEKFQPREIMVAKREVGLGPNDFVVGYIGTFPPEHGVEYLIECAPLVLKQHPNTKFLLVGDGILRHTLQRKVEDMNIGRAFLFTGSVPYQEAPKFINACDITILTPTRQLIEQMGISPLKIYEYMACGRPCIVAHHGSLANFITESKAGIVIEPENPQALAEAILRLAESSDERKLMGRNARQVVLDNYSWAHIAQQVEQVCRDAFDSNKSERK